MLAGVTTTYSAAPPALILRCRACPKTQSGGSPRCRVFACRRLRPAGLQNCACSRHCRADQSTARQTHFHQPARPPQTAGANTPPAGKDPATGTEIVRSSFNACLFLLRNALLLHRRVSCLRYAAKAEQDIRVFRHIKDNQERPQRTCSGSTPVRRMTLLGAEGLT